MEIGKCEPTHGERLMVGKTKPMTTAERARIAAMMRLGCVYCAYMGMPAPAEECHHIVEGMKRLGHWYTIPLCRKDHRDINQLTRINEPSERYLWEKVQKRLHLSLAWPVSKILARRLA